MYSKFLHIIPNSEKYQNTYNNFTVRLPEFLKVDDTFEVALTEINIPHIFRNIAKDSFITVVKCRQDNILDIDNIDFILKIKVKAGYYRNGRHLLDKIHERASKIVEDPSKKFLSPPNNYDSFNHEFFYQKNIRKKRDLDKPPSKKRKRASEENLNPFKPGYDPWYGTHLKDPDVLNVENVKPIISENIQKFITSELKKQNVLINESISKILVDIKDIFKQNDVEKSSSEKNIKDIWIMISDIKNYFVKRFDDIIEEINKSIGNLINTYNITLISDIKEISEATYKRYFNDVLNLTKKIEDQISKLFKNESGDILENINRIEEEITSVRNKISSTSVITQTVGNTIEELIEKIERNNITRAEFDKNVISEISSKNNELLDKFDIIFTILKSNEDLFMNEMSKSKNVLISKINDLLYEIKQIKIYQNEKNDQILNKSERIETALMENVKISLDNVINEIKRTRKNTNKKISQNKNDIGEHFNKIKSDFLNIIKENFSNHFTALKNTESAFNDKINNIINTLKKFKKSDETAKTIWNDISSLNVEISSMIKNQNHNIQKNISNKFDAINKLMNTEINESTRIKRELVKKNIQHNLDIRKEFEDNDIIRKISEIEHVLEQKIHEIAFFYKKGITELLNTFSNNQNEFMIKLNNLISKIDYIEETTLGRMLNENLIKIQEMLNNTNEKINSLEKSFNNINTNNIIINEISDKFEKVFLPKIITEMGNLYVRNYDYFSNLNDANNYTSYSMIRSNKSATKIYDLIRLNYDKFSNHSEILATSDDGYTHFNFENSLSKILGFEKDIFHIKNSEKMMSLSQINLQNIQTIFVYCNFVKDVTISDINSPLLAIVPIPDLENYALGTNINISFPIRNYIKMREKNNLQELTFWLRDSFGEKLHFDYSLSPIILTLHVKHTQNDLNTLNI